MDPRQLQLFKRITLDYFAKLSPGDEPVLDPPYLQFGEPALLDYASLVRIRGEYEGCLYLTSPVRLLHSLLRLHGETEVSERTLRDMCRELSNVLSGNASQAFSGEWQISVPLSLGPGDFKDLRLPPSAFVMPIRWRDSTALLVVGLQAARNGG
jgi:Chemotaxis phosphatase CheX